MKIKLLFIKITNICQKMLIRNGTSNFYPLFQSEVSSQIFDLTHFLGGRYGGRSGGGGGRGSGGRGMGAPRGSRGGRDGGDRGRYDRSGGAGGDRKWGGAGIMTLNCIWRKMF